MAKEYYEFDTATSELKPMDDSKKKKKRKDIFANVDKWKLAKQIVGAMASGCASIMVGKYLRSSMPATDSMMEKAVMDVGMYVVTGIVGSAAMKYVDQEMDAFRESITIASDIPEDLVGE